MQQRVRRARMQHVGEEQETCGFKPWVDSWRDVQGEDEEVQPDTAALYLEDVASDISDKQQEPPRHLHPHLNDVVRPAKKQRAGGEEEPAEGLRGRSILARRRDSPLCIAPTRHQWLRAPDRG
eukprot:746919-Hanusia_phi.AAC.6